MNNKIIIGEEYDGWTVVIGDKSYRWNHNDVDMGTLAIKEILEDLGYEAEIEEWY